VLQEEAILVTQGNLATTYGELGHLEKALSMVRDVYSGWLKLKGKDHYDTLREANNYGSSLVELDRFEEAKSLLRKTVPVARRVLGESQDLMLQMRWNYARSLYKAPSATLDDLREAVTTLEETEPIARRVLGSGHPIAKEASGSLERARRRLANFKPK